MRPQSTVQLVAVEVLPMMAAGPTIEEEQSAHQDEREKLEAARQMYKQEKAHFRAQREAERQERAERKARRSKG